MRSLITKVIAGGMLLACFAIAMPEDAEAQRRGRDRDHRGGRDWDRDGYWGNYWNWYDNRYRGYYNRRSRGDWNRGRRDYGYDRRGYGSRYGYGGGYYRGNAVQVGPVGVYWR